MVVRDLWNPKIVNTGADGGAIACAGDFMAACFLRAVAANPASRLFTLDLGKQPHRENHEEPEECDDILKAVVPECMLEIGGNGGDENDEE
jgi:hypothetical protein